MMDNEDDKAKCN